MSIQLSYTFLRIIFIRIPYLGRNVASGLSAIGWADSSFISRHSSMDYIRRGSTCTLCMTRKDQMREGFVARTFHIPIDIDDELRVNVRFSDMAILAFKEFLRGGRKDDGRK